MHQCQLQQGWTLTDHPPGCPGTRDSLVQGAQAAAKTPSLAWCEGHLSVLVTWGNTRGIWGIQQLQAVVTEEGAVQSSPISSHPSSSHRSGAAGSAMGQTFPYKNNISSFFLISSFEIID